MNVIAVDVGTTSVRLAIIRFQGDQLNEVSVIASHMKDIDHVQDELKFEQSSKNIWHSICECSKICITKSGTSPESIRGIAFSATCSLVIIGGEDARNRENDIIMWMDHRAIAEAQTITTSKSNVLEQFGGICSPEFSLAKLLWLKNNEPDRLNSAVGLFELPDWLVHRCIGGDPRLFRPSLCCMVCKWGYDAETKCHCDIISSLGEKLGDKISNKAALGPGVAAGFLSHCSAEELGLIAGGGGDDTPNNKENMPPTGVVVGTSLIDAHSGMLAMLSVPLDRHGINLKIETTFCSLAGTSSCHMLLSRQRNFTHGIWGPYKDVVLQGYYLLEAGQSLTGKLIEICIESHEEGKKLLEAGRSIKEIIRKLNGQASKISKDISLHVLPTFHGNRSPLANPRLRGGIYGLSSEGQKTLLDHYIATVESIVYETKLIVETLGINLETILVSGGLMKNDLFMQTLADVLFCQAVKMSIENVDFMVLGSSLVARQAVLNFNNGNNSKRSLELPFGQAMTESSIADMKFKQLAVGIYKPRKDRRRYHEKRYLCYKEFVEFSKRVDNILYQ